MNAVERMRRLRVARVDPTAPRPPEPPLIEGAATQRLAPFLDRIRADLAGRYCQSLEWPEGGRLVSDPAAHWDTYRDRLPTELTDVLYLLAEGWRCNGHPAVDDWPLAPEHYQWEYSRLAAWFKAAPKSVPAQIVAWGEGATAYPNRLYEPDQPAASASDRPQPAPETWGEQADLLALLDQLQPDDLPPSFVLRPGVTATDASHFLASLKFEAARGPSGLRARQGLLATDIADLLAALACGDQPTEDATTRLVGSPPLRQGMSPVEHLAELGGFAGAQRLTGTLAHLLWDAARLWRRDQGTDRAERWERQYQETWAKVEAKTGTPCNSAPPEIAP